MNSAPNEETLAKITDDILGVWKKFLKRPDMVSEDNFFNSGGDSILAVRIAHEIENTLGLTVDPMLIFINPTANKLAASIHPELRPIERIITVNSKLQDIEATPFQQELYILELLKRRNERINRPQPFILPEIDPKIIGSAFADLLSNHEILTTTFHLVANKIVQRHNSSFNLDDFFICHDLRSSEDLNLQDCYEKVANRSFDLKSGPLCRMDVILLKDKTVCLLSTHHILSDGLSEDIIIRDLVATCSRTDSKTPARKPSFQFKDYALWYEKWRKSIAGQKSLEYWRPIVMRATNLKPVFPIDENSKGFLAESLKVTLEKKIVTGIRHLMSSQNVTLFIALQALTKAFLYKRYGCKEVAVGSVFSTRTLEIGPNDLGPYINVLPLLDSVCDNSSFVDFVKQVKETVISSHKHRLASIAEITSPNSNVRLKWTSPKVLDKINRAV